MKWQKLVLVMMFSFSCSMLMLGAPVSAEQGAAKEAEGSHGSPAGMECCQKKGEQAAAMECCRKKGEQADGKSCCANHEGSHGAMHEGSHGEKAKEGSH